jgi:hypothetical protein
MSTVAYGVLTETRKQSPGDAPSAVKAAGLGTYVDVLVGLVPAEVLAAHAFILTLATKAEKNAAGENVVTITQKGALQATFWALIVLAAVLFFVGRYLQGGNQKFDWRWDTVRLLVPPAAFGGWTMCATRALWRGIIRPVRHLVRAKPELSGAYVVLVGDTIAAALLRGTVLLSAAPFVVIVAPAGLAVAAFALSAAVVHPVG